MNRVKKNNKYEFLSIPIYFLEFNYNPKMVLEYRFVPFSLQAGYCMIENKVLGSGFLGEKQV